VTASPDQEARDRSGPLGGSSPVTPIDAGGGRGTATMREWNAFKQRNPNARLACIDVQPYRTVQAVEREDILNIGGFSDHVFEVISEFARGQLNADHWIGVIESVAL